MSIINTVIRRPVTLLIIFILVIVIGIYTIGNIPVELFPEINPPVLTISSSFPGASPREIEQSITEPLESVLGNVNNLQRMESTISKGGSSITMEFSYGTDLDVATNNVRDRLDLARGALPSDSNTVIFQFDPQAIPVIVLGVSGNRDAAEVYDLVDARVSPFFERLPGVAQAWVVGGDEQIVRVEIPLERLEAYQLTINEVVGLLQQNNTQVFGGELTEGSFDYVVETVGEIVKIEDIKNTVIAYRTSGRQTHPIRVRDVANVYYDQETRDTQVYINGDPAVYIAVIKRSVANTVNVSDDVLTAIPALLETLPPDMDIITIWDSAELIRDSIISVSGSALIGGVLAIFILLLFLRSIRSTLVIASSIPVSIIITLLTMYFFGLSLNIMTLAGLALGVGMLVDNSIVILENIYQYRGRGANLRSSALLGSREMVTPIVASTLTTIGVFFPLFLFRNRLEVVGEFFSALAFTVVVALLSSLAIAILLVPVLSSHYFRIRTRRQNPLRGFLGMIDRALEMAYEGVEALYGSAMKFLLRHRFWGILIVLVLAVVPIVLVQTPQFEFFPDVDEGSVELNIELPPGSQGDVTRSVLISLERALLETAPKGSITSTTVEIGASIRGASNVTRNEALGTLSAYLASGSLSVFFPGFEEKRVTSEDIRDILRQNFDKYPQVQFRFSGGGSPVSSGEAIQILVKGQDLDQIRSVSNQMLEIMQEEESGFFEAQLDEPAPVPRMNVLIDREKAYSLGLNVAGIGREINAALDGVRAGKLRRPERNYDIVVSLPSRNRDNLSDLRKVFIFSPNRDKILLDNIASFERTVESETISRIDQNRYMKVVSQTGTTDAVVPLVNELKRRVQQEVIVPEGVIIEYGGEFEDTETQTTTFILFAVLAIILIFGIMAALFESFLDPFLILFTIPLTLVGVLLVYGLTGEKMNSLTAVGLIMLIGIVVNTGIVLVDHTNLLRKRGSNILDASREAGKRRLRPILMTTLTTILGMTPLAFFETEGSVLIQPIAKTVVGGLVSSTFLTLFFIPILYAIFNTRTDKIKEFFAKKAERKEEEIQQILQEQEHGPS